MGLFRRKPRLVTINRGPLRCLICAHQEFFDREVKLNSTAMELFDLGWANQSVLGLICAGCGYVHQFAGDGPELWDRDGGYPQSSR